MYVDFQKVKSTVSLEKAIALLRLDMELCYGSQYRGRCPACDTKDGRSLVITPDKGWYCFSERKGGDVISLAAHVRKTGMKEAAEFLTREEVVPVSPSAPEPKAVKNMNYSDMPCGWKPPEVKQKFDAQKYRDGLQTEHELLQKCGLSKEFCIERGIGVPAKGTHKGLIAIPTWDAQGHVVYVGVPEVHLPRLK